MRKKLLHLACFALMDHATPTENPQIVPSLYSKVSALTNFKGVLLHGDGQQPAWLLRSSPGTEGSISSCLQQVRSLIHQSCVVNSDWRCLSWVAGRSFTT